MANSASAFTPGGKTRFKETMKSELWVLKAAVSFFPEKIKSIRNFKLADISPRNIPSTTLRIVKGTDMFGYS